MARIPLKDLLNSIAGIAETWTDPVQASDCFTGRPTVEPGYVWPDVEVSLAELQPLVLVQSSGAMGKSCASRAIAHGLKAPVIDLSHTRVGADSLHGLLARSLDWVGAAEFTGELRAGRRSLVLDGLDEAQLLVGKDNYLAFLVDVLDLVDRDGPPGQVIAFGRHDAIETAHLVAMDRWGTSDPKVVSLLPLSMGQAHALIDSKLDADPRFQVHRQHPESWRSLRDEQLRDLAGALLGRRCDDVGADWGEVDDFLGYPPVVMAIAESLKEENPGARLQELKAAEGAITRTNRGRLLHQVVQDIMRREQSKVSAHLTDALELDPALSKLLFADEEQIVRVVAETTGMAFGVIPPEKIPTALKAQYEEQVRPWVRDHPFLRDGEFVNAVFRDFVRAFLATATITEFFGVRRSELMGACGRVGPFFAHFVHALTSAPPTGDEEAAPGWVSEEMVDDLMKSNALGAADMPQAMYTHHSERAHLMLGEQSDRRPWLSFVIEEPSGVLVLRSPLSHMYVDTAGAVVIEPTDDRLDFGPAFMVLAEEIELGGHSLVAYPSSESGAGSILLAERVGHAPDLKIRTHGDHALFVSWENPTFQWRPYSFQKAEGGLGTLATRQQQRLYQGIRRLLTGFRAGDAPWMYYERYDNFVVGQNPLLLSIKDRFTELGVLKRTGDHYTLAVDVLGDFGVSYAALRNADWQTTLRPLAQEVLKATQVQSVLG